MLFGFGRRPRMPVLQLSRRETLRRISTQNVSLSRFGDGELIYCLKQRALRFQQYDPRLRDRLLRALLDPPAGVLAAFNNHFAASDEVHWIVAYERYPKPFARMRTVKTEGDVGVLLRGAERRAYTKFWRYVAHHTQAREYGDAAVFFLGSYVQEYENGEIEGVLDDFRALFNRRRILFVCPDTPLGGLSFQAQEAVLKRIGVRSAQFLAIPNTDAFAHCAVIETQIRSMTGFDDVFIQAGPLASVIASELGNEIDGRILDVGSLNTQLRYLA